MSVSKGNLRRLTGMFAHPYRGNSVIYTGDSHTHLVNGGLWDSMMEWANEGGCRFVMRPGRSTGRGPTHALFVASRDPEWSEVSSLIRETEEAMDTEIRVRLQDRN